MSETTEPTATTESGDNPDNESEENEKTTVADVKNVLLNTKVEGNKSVWAMTLDTFGMADGKNKKNDVFVESIQEGLEILNSYVTARQKEREDIMDLVPLQQFNATQDQFLTAFLRWAEKEDTKDSSKTQINVSKVHRRLDAYFEWMTDNAENFVEPLTAESIAHTAKVWDMQVTYDKEGRFLWWIDVGGLNKEEIKKLENRDHLRYIVWFSHLCMFDPKAQENGIILIQDMGQIGFMKCFTLVPAELGTKMDRLTIGILPIRMTSIIVFGAARWMTFLMGLMKPFMSKKMRERVVVVPRKTDNQQFCDNMFTRESIPKGFGGLEGEAAKDAFL